MPTLKDLAAGAASTLASVDAARVRDPDSLCTQIEGLTTEVKTNDALVKDQVVANDTALKKAVEANLTSAAANDEALKVRLQQHSLAVEEQLRVLDVNLRSVASGSTTTSANTRGWRSPA